MNFGYAMIFVGGMIVGWSLHTPPEPHQPPSQLERACPTEHRPNGTKLVADYLADDGACHWVVRPFDWKP